MRLIISLISLFIAVWFSGCLRTYYPAIYGSRSPAMITKQGTPGTFDKYIAADVTNAVAFYDDEKNLLLRGHYLLVNTGDHYSLNYGLFGYTGFYEVSGVKSFDGKKSYDGLKNYVGLGPELNSCVNFKVDRFRAGIGAYVALCGEFGEYHHFRKASSKDHITESHTNLLNFLLSVYPVIGYDISENTNISAQMNVGVPGLVSPIIVLNNKNASYWISWTQNDYRSDIYKYGSFSIGTMINLNSF